MTSFIIFITSVGFVIVTVFISDTVYLFMSDLSDQSSWSFIKYIRFTKEQIFDLVFLKFTFIFYLLIPALCYFLPLIT